MLIYAALFYPFPNTNSDLMEIFAYKTVYELVFKACIKVLYLHFKMQKKPVVIILCKNTLIILTPYLTSYQFTSKFLFYANSRTDELDLDS